MLFRLFPARFLFLAAAVAVICSTARADAPPEPPSRKKEITITKEDERSTVQGTIKLFLAALEEEGPDYAKIVRDFADPELLETLEKEGKFDELVKRFANEGVPKLIKVLKYLNGKEPSDSSGDTVVFRLDPAQFQDTGPQISFIKVDGRYYLKN